MRLLQYKDLDLASVRLQFHKVRAAIEADDFRSADVKKLSPGPYYRAKLDYANRLLLQFAKVDGKTVCLALEVIGNHAYERSRFLRGATVDEARIEREPAVDPAAPGDALPMRWLHASHARFELLDKPIVFDDAQEAVYRQPVPLVLVGSAGSGKTAVTLAKLREADGPVLYVTLSPYLAKNALALYSAHGYVNPRQEVVFLSYREFVETLRVPAGREITLAAFRDWLGRHRQAASALGQIDAHALFEEFRGVLGAQVSGPLALADYLALGPRQSLLPVDRREAAHRLFERYRQWLAEAGLFDLNLVAHASRPLAEPAYDFVVVDEVQDMTPVQLALVLAVLRKPGQFLLCGDSHQIVHPNFFNWAQVKTLFWQGLAGTDAQRQTAQVLQTNFRNTRRVTEIANRLLKLKQARFGSVDRESHFLVGSASGDEGSVTLVAADATSVRALDAATRRSARHAVVVLRDEDKARAREVFGTPLVFSVHEAKGLEYPHVLLFDLVSGQRQAYAAVCEGVAEADLDDAGFEYGRAKNKTDKSLELYKFYVNALYVAMTRAVESLTIVEADPGHPMLHLLGLRTGTVAVQGTSTSTSEEWAQEARKLALQGKDEQAAAIREAFLKRKPPPWTPWSQPLIEELAVKALDPKNPSAKQRQTIFDYALWHGQQAWVERLGAVNFAASKALLDEGRFRGAGTRIERYGGLPEWTRVEEFVRRSVSAVRQRHLQTYAARNVKDVLRSTDLHGVDHATAVGATPLMMAARAGNASLVEALLERGADPERRDEFGQTAWQQATCRAMEDPDFARAGLAPLFDRLAPAVIDVQTDGRLVRLEPQQGEYWVLTLLLAGLKTQWSRCALCSFERPRYPCGFFAEQLHEVLDALPPWLWTERRRKRGYVNQVLARAERDSPYRPSRRLWVRSRHGHYLPDPQMGLRRGDAWQPVYEAMNLAWVDRGCRAPDDHGMNPLAIVERAGAGRGAVGAPIEGPAVERR